MRSRSRRPAGGALCVLRRAGDELGLRRAGELAHELGLPLREACEIGHDELVLAVADGALELRPGDRVERPGVRVDFAQRSLVARARARPGHADVRQPLLRAIGRPGGLVVDATAGFGGDAIALASHGHHVTALERSPVLAALLEDGHARALADATLSDGALRLALRCADARSVLAALAESPDAVYIDPMYPPGRRRSALPRLEMQLLRRLVGDDDDAGELFEVAMTCGAGRVVVKRPLTAAPLGAGPASQHAGKLVRYDVYATRRA